MNPFLEANKKLWDAKTFHHVNSDFYRQKEFLQGECSLKEIELEELGDVKGKSLLHLQCHFGQDTISWARRGADTTGIDFSPKAIAHARKMNEQLDLDVKFIESNVLELDKNLEGKYDIIFTSYGVIGWLPDLESWARIINHFLKSGGTFLIVEFHPTMWLFDWNKMELAYHYFNVGKPDHEIEQGTYADTEADISMDEYTWSHSLEEVVMSLMGEGLSVESFREFPFSPYDCFDNMKEVGENRYKFNNVSTEIPYVFSLKMKKP